MRGVNVIELNEATVIDAIQHYFDTVLFASGKSPVITGFSQKSGGYGANSFTVAVSDTAESHKK